MYNDAIIRKIPKITTNIRNVINYESTTDKNEITKYVNKLFNYYLLITPKYIKDKQIQHNRFFTCCDDIAIAIQKRKMEGK